MAIKFLRSTEVKTKDSIRNETFRDEIGISYQRSKREMFTMVWPSPPKIRKIILIRALEFK